MKLSDVMSNAGLSVYAEIALVIFLAIFVIAALRTYRREARETQEHLARLPMDDGHATALTNDGGAR